MFLKQVVDYITIKFLIAVLNNRQTDRHKIQTDRQADKKTERERDSLFPTKRRDENIIL